MGGRNSDCSHRIDVKILDISLLLCYNIDDLRVNATETHLENTLLPGMPEVAFFACEHLKPYCKRVGTGC